MRYLKYLVFSFIVISFSQTIKPFGADLTEEEQIELAKLMSLEAESKRIQEESNKTEEDAELKKAIQMSLESQAKDKKHLSQEEQKRVNDMLWDGVKAKNAALVNKALTSGANFNILIQSNIPIHSKITPLIYSSSVGYEDIIKTLLDAGADPNIRDDYGRTSLMYASLSGYESAVRMLLENGANPNIIDDGGETAADKAKKNGYKAIEQILREAQRQAVKKEIIKNTPLIPEFAEIISEYAECLKPENSKRKEIK